MNNIIIIAEEPIGRLLIEAANRMLRELNEPTLTQHADGEATARTKCFGLIHLRPPLNGFKAAYYDEPEQIAALQPSVGDTPYFYYIGYQNIHLAKAFINELPEDIPAYIDFGDDAYRSIAKTKALISNKPPTWDPTEEYAF